MNLLMLSFFPPVYLPVTSTNDFDMDVDKTLSY